MIIKCQLIVFYTHPSKIEREATVYNVICITQFFKFLPLLHHDKH